MPRLKRRRSQGASLRRSIFSLPTALSFVLGAALIVFLAVTFDLDWKQTWQNIRSMNPWLYGLALIVYFLSFIFRGARWRILAQNAEPQQPERDRLPSILATSQLILIGWFVNSVTWLRLGDAYRAYAFAEDSRTTFSWSLGTVVAERLLDMATVAGLIVISIVVLTVTSGLTVSRYILIIALAMALAIGSIVVWMRLYGTHLARILPTRLEATYHRFHQGTLGSFDQLPTVLSLGVVGWLLEMARLYLVLQALDISVGLALVPVVALGHAVLSTVPTPGGVGAVEPGVTGLLLIELSRPEAAAVAITDRSITYLSVLVIGGMFFMVRQIVRLRRREIEGSGTTPGTGCQ